MEKCLTIRQTNGNKRNKINGSRLRFYREGSKTPVAEVDIPTYKAKQYLFTHPKSKYVKQVYDQLFRYGDIEVNSLQELKASIDNY